MDISNQQVYDGHTDPKLLTPELGNNGSSPNVFAPVSKGPSSGTASMGATSEEPDHGLASKMKFRKKSDMDQQNLNAILDTKARISINTKTGKHEFHYQNQESVTKNQPYLMNSDSMVKMQDSAVSSTGFGQPLEPIRPSKVVWQLPYDERKSYMQDQADNLIRIS